MTKRTAVRILIAALSLAAASATAQTNAQKAPFLSRRLREKWECS